MMYTDDVKESSHSGAAGVCVCARTLRFELRVWVCGRASANVRPWARMFAGAYVFMYLRIFV